MDKYNVKYEIAKMYIENIYYIEDKEYNVKKLDMLVEIKNELEKNNLLKYNEMFRKYVQNIDVIVYGIRLNKFEKCILSTVNYQYVVKDYNEHEHEVL
jgi:hypothetical protein